jgi:hypothetical protein
MTPRNCEIVDCGAFCEVILFRIFPKNLLGDFFDSLTSKVVWWGKMQTQDFGREVMGYWNYPIIFLNSSSVRVLIPNSLALSDLEPGSSPTTT